MRGQGEGPVARTTNRAGGGLVQARSGIRAMRSKGGSGPPVIKATFNKKVRGAPGHRGSLGPANMEL